MSLPEDKPISLREALERKLNSTGLRCSAPRNAVDKVKLHPSPPEKVSQIVYVFHLTVMLNPSDPATHAGKLLRRVLAALVRG